MDAKPPPGLLGSARLVLVALLEIGQTRLQLASTELEEERSRVAELLLCATVSLFFLGIGAVFAAMLLVVVYRDGHRELVLGGVTALFLAVGLGMAAIWRRKSRRKPGLLNATITELQRDRDELRGADPDRR